MIVSQDLLLQCLAEDPSARITAEAALSHPLLASPPPLPLPGDPALLPSPVLFLEPEEEQDQEEELLERVRRECSSYGEIQECCLSEGGGAFVHFQEVRTARRAKTQLESENLDWSVSYWPLELWRDRSLT